MSTLITSSITLFPDDSIAFYKLLLNKNKSSNELLFVTLYALVPNADNMFSEIDPSFINLVYSVLCLSKESLDISAN
jgi:hypothetical protein